MRRNRIPLMWMLVILVVLLAACGGSQDATLPVSGGDDLAPADATASVEAALDVAPLDSPTPPTVPAGEGGGASNVPPGAPDDVTGFELIATELGVATYSGFICVPSPVGCACDTPVIWQAEFTFVDEETINYRVASAQFAFEWDLTRIGRNQWSRTNPIFWAEGDQVGEYFGADLYLFTFVEDGYIQTQAGHFADGTAVSCPDVYFHRLRDE